MKVQHKIALKLVKSKLNFLAAVSPAKAGEEAFRLFCTPLTRYTGDEAEIFKQAEKLEIRLEDKTIRGYRCNAPQQKKALLLHGFSSSCHKFDRYAAALVGKDYEVLAFDAPAHGGSDGATTNALEYSLFIQAVNKQFGPIDAYIGHSFGGLAAALALEDIPHHSNTKLVLIAPATETTSAIEGALKFLNVNNPVVRTALHEAIFKRNQKEPAWYSIRRAVQNIQASILWIHDEDDDVTPFADAEKVKEDNHANIRFIITKGLGHQRIYRTKKTLDTVMNFL